MEKKEYAKGLFFNMPHERAPEFVIGTLSVSKENFMEWLAFQEPDEKGYIKIDIKKGKERPYCELNTYKRNG